MTRIIGTDLATYQPNVDYDAMADFGVRFGCIKLGQGTWKDDLFGKHVAEFNARKIPWDLYWFADYRTTGLINARSLVKFANSDYGAGHPVLDLEYYKGFGPRPDGWHFQRWALDFFAEFEKLTGIKAMFYTNRDMLNQIFTRITPANKAEFLLHPLWLATHANFGNPAPWPKYQLNQYELDFAVPWSKSKVDLDEFNGTEAEFAAWYHLTPPDPNPCP